MGCCGCKKWLKLLAGLAFLAIVGGYLNYSPWLVFGLYYLLAGLLPIFCPCDCCKGNWGMPAKKKK